MFERMIDDRRQIRAHLHHFGVDDLLITPGEYPAGIFLIERGKVEVFKEVDRGTISIARLGRGDIVGELALITGRQHRTGVRAIEATDCLLIDIGEFKALHEQTPLAMRIIVSRLARKLARLNKVTYGV